MILRTKATTILISSLFLLLQGNDKESNYCYAFVIPRSSSNTKTYHHHGKIPTSSSSSSTIIQEPSSRSSTSKSPFVLSDYYSNDGEFSLDGDFTMETTEIGMKASTGDGLYSLSVSDLKLLLTERGVDFRDCLEKRDLVERLRETELNPSSSSSTSKSRSNQKEPSSSSSGFVPSDNYNNNLGRSSSSSNYYNNDLLPEERSVISTFKRVSPSAAYIQTSSVVQQVRGWQLQSAEVPVGSGSGFLWDDKGHVVTNYHVIVAGNPNTPLPSSVKVKLAGMLDSRDADVVGVEPEKDLAVLRLRDRSNLPNPIDVGTSNNVQVGQSVLAIGKPFGLDDTLTTGIVSALGRDVMGIGGRPIRGCIQTDAAINPGNSGGPLLDSSGRLIGVNTAIFSPGANAGVAGNVGIGFAIPVDTVRRVVNQIIRYGKVVRPTLGLSVVNDKIKQSIEQQLRRKVQGVLVAEVYKNSPAQSAGIVATQLNQDGSLVIGDVISAVDNGTTIIKDTEDLLSAIEEKNDGDTVTLTVMRNANPKRIERIKVKLTTRDKLSSTMNGSSSQIASSSSRQQQQQSGGRRGGRLLDFLQ